MLQCHKNVQNQPRTACRDWADRSRRMVIVFYAPNFRKHASIYEKVESIIIDHRETGDPREHRQ